MKTAAEFIVQVIDVFLNNVENVHDITPEKLEQVKEFKACVVNLLTPEKTNEISTVLFMLAAITSALHWRESVKQFKSKSEVMFALVKFIDGPAEDTAFKVGNLFANDLLDDLPEKA